MYWRKIHFHRRVEVVLLHWKRDLAPMYLCGHRKPKQLRLELSWSRNHLFLMKRKKVGGEKTYNMQHKSSGATNFTPQVSMWGKKVPAKPRSERCVRRLNTKATDETGRREFQRERRRRSRTSIGRWWRSATAAGSGPLDEPQWKQSDI